MSIEEHREYKALIELTVDQLSEAQACGDTSIIREVAQEFLASEGFATQVADNVFRQLEQRLLAIDVETAQLQLLRAQGKTVPTPPLQDIDDEALQLTSLLQPWAKGRAIQEKTVTEAKAGIRMYSEWSVSKFGRVRAVNRLSVEDAAEFREWLLAYVPTRYRATGKTLHPMSVKKYLGLLGGIVSYYSTDRTVNFPNVFVLVKKPHKSRGSGKARIGFTDEQLIQLFTHDRVKSLRHSADVLERTEFWFLVLGPLTGGRLEELGQMLVRDVKDFDGKLFLRLCDDAEGQSIKTSDGSGGGIGARLVPVHPELLALGFDAYVANQRRRVGSEGRLFDALKPDSHGSLTGYLSKKLNLLLDRVGLSDPRLAYHSFRHTFKHFARMCGIPKAILDQLTGHETGEVGDAYGGENYPIEPLIEGMKLYRLPFLDLSHLYPNAGGVAK